MFLTETDFINERIREGARRNNSEILRELIQEDIRSDQKRKMEEGERYYQGKHDILSRDFTVAQISETATEWEEDGKEVEREFIRPFRNPNRSNHHTVNAFHQILIDQKVSYLVGREPTISVSGQEEYNTLLAKWADENFNIILQDLIVGAGNHGFEAIHFTYLPTGELTYCIIPGTEIIPVYDTVHEKELVELIRYYSVKVSMDGETKLQKRVEWWTKTDVTYYVEDAEDSFSLDFSVNPNPSPHIWVFSSLHGQKKVPHSWGRVPFVLLKNNRHATTDLESIKGLIDAYDLISSEGVNNLLDLVQLYWVIAGYGGETAGAIAKKLQINKAVNVSDSSGKIEAKQIEIPMESRLAYLKMLRRDIFHFGMGVDVDSETFGTAPSGVSLKFRYELLNLKAGKMEARLKKAIKDFFWFFTDDYNRHNKTNFDSNEIQVVLNKNVILNDMETVDMILKSSGIVSNQTLLGHHPFVEDVNEELREVERQEKKKEAYFDSYRLTKKTGDEGEEF